MTTRHQAPKRRIKRNRQEEILISAKELFFTKGYRLTTIEEIASRAGYSKRSVYLDFTSKDDLFITISNDGLEMVINRLRKLPGETMDFESYVMRYLETIMAFAVDHPEYFKMLTADVTPEIIANCSEAVRMRAYQIERAGIELMAETAKRAMNTGAITKGNPWEIAEILIGSVVGIITLTMSGSQAMMSQAELRKKVRKLGRLLCRGLSTAGKNDA
ncbi:MAG: TetR/AcrR family transcriptional regulator [Spirochaetes bacterium]|nr:TetR/AcrR family transcriptional regulator [Spirochaetota bacterium]